MLPAAVALYGRRKAAIERSLGDQLTVLQNRARFISEVAANEIELTSGDLSRPELVQLLRERGVLDAWLRRQFEPFFAKPETLAILEGD